MNLGSMKLKAVFNSAEVVGITPRDVASLPSASLYSSESTREVSDALVSDVVNGMTFESRDGVIVFKDQQISISYTGPLSSPVVWSSSDEGIATISPNGFVTHLDNGTTTITANIGPTELDLVLNLSVGDPGVTWIMTGYSGESVSSVLSTTIRDMMIVGGDIEYYLGFSNGDTTAETNPDRWFTPDLSASAIATTVLGGWSTANSGVLITPRVFLGVQHYDGFTGTNLTAGVQLKFRNAAGTVFTRTILSRYQLSPYDAYCCILDSALPASVVPMKIAGNWSNSEFADGFWRTHGMGFQVHQDKKVRPVIFDSMYSHGTVPNVPSPTQDFSGVQWTNTAVNFTSPDHWLFGFDSYFAAGQPGDSGGVVGVVVNGEAVLMSLFTGMNYGVFYFEGFAEDRLNQAIQSAAALAGVTVTDTVTVAPSPI